MGNQARLHRGLDYRHLAACDHAVVQGGLTTARELTASWQAVPAGGAPAYRHQTNRDEFMAAQREAQEADRIALALRTDRPAPSRDE